MLSIRSLLLIVFYFSFYSFLNSQIQFHYAPNGGMDTIAIIGNHPSIEIIGDTEICPENNLLLQVDAPESITWSTMESGNTINPFISGDITFYAVATNDLGCTDTAYHQVTVLPVPDMPVIQVSGTTLTASLIATTYEWYLDDVLLTGKTTRSIDITATGSYRVAVFNEYGCLAESNAVYVSVNIECYDDWNGGSIPILGNYYSPNAIELDQAILFGDVSFYSADKIVLQPGFRVAAGAKFKGAIELLNACPANANGSNSSASAFLTPPIPAKNEFSVYPNPASRQISINYQLAGMQAEKVLLLDFNGQLIQTLPLSAKENGQLTIDLSDLPAGMYALVLYTSHQPLMKKLAIIN